MMPGSGSLQAHFTLESPVPLQAHVSLEKALEYTAPADATSGGTLTGTPTVPAQAAAWTLTATDADGDTATLTFTVEVAPNLMLSFGDAQVPPQRYVQGLEIDPPLVLPAATGGDGPLAYTLAPALPDGLGYTAPADARSGGTLAGTPAVPAQAAAWTLTATDADGDTATLTFTIEVLDRLRVRLKGINEALLPDLSRAMTASTMDAVSGRIGQALSGDGAGTHGAMASADVLTGLAGLLQANEQALEDGTWSWKQGLDGRRFALALGKVEGEYESRMTSAHPYVGWAWPAGRHAWASLGYGRATLPSSTARRAGRRATARCAARRRAGACGCSRGRGRGSSAR